MDRNEHRDTPVAPSNALTLEAPSTELYTSNPPQIIADSRFRQSQSAAPCPRIAMEAVCPKHLSNETHSLLRTRLRAAALSLAFGFTLFFIRNAIVKHWTDRADVIWLYFQFLVTAGLVVISGSLCWKCTSSTKVLRVKELLIFSLPASYFLAMQFSDRFGHGLKHGFIESPTSPWLMLIFTYALFIPNTWKRAALVMGLLATAPVAVLLYLFLTDVEFQDLMNWYHIASIGLMLVVGCVVGAFGVYTIGQLRREAFAARQFGQYRLKRLLGQGGMGEVYLAEHQLMKRPCAIKLIRPGKAGDPHALARFEREVRSTAKLSHWNTIEIFDYGRTDDGTFYYVMEYLPGLSLAELVERSGPLAPERVVHLLRQTCDALGEAHSLGLMHRDIKPGNIFAAQRGGIYDVAKLLDFGLAKPLTAGVDVMLTQEGTITGSPLYMSPEQATGDREPDARSDIYSLGAVAYFLLTGRPPFNDDRPMKVLISHASVPPTPPSQFKSDLPGDVEDVVMRCLAKDPIDRYQDAGALSAALAACDSADRWTRDDAARWWATRSNTHTELEPLAAAG